MITSTSNFAALRAWLTVWIWWITFAPASCARSTRSPGYPSAKEMTAGFASRVARKVASSSSGTTWLTAKCRRVISRTRSICLWMLSTVSKTAPILPRPPASETAATSFGAVASQIAAYIIGTFIPNKSHTGVRNMALLPARPGAVGASLSIDNIMPPTDPPVHGTRPMHPSVWKGSSANFAGRRFSAVLAFRYPI
jgi:hypothetical protein